MSDLANSFWLPFWGAITLICVVPSVAHYWWRIRQAELDAALKQDMLQRGLSAEEIRVVLHASSKGNYRKDARDSAEA